MMGQLEFKHLNSRLCVCVEGLISMESLTKEQTRIVDEFAEKHHVSKETSLRFLLGRKWDRDRADTLLCNYLNLIEEKKFKEMSINEIFDEMATGKLAILSTKAKDGTAILVINAKNHQPGTFSDADTLKLSYFMAELMTRDTETQKNGITILCNMEGLNWEQSDYGFYRDVVQMFQNNFPCRVKNVIVFSPPWWIQFLVGLINPFLKPKMRERIHMEVEREALLAWIDKESLPEELGGLYHYDHELFMKKQMAKAAKAKVTGLMSTTATHDDDDESLDEVEFKNDKIVENSGDDDDDTMIFDDNLAGELVEEREKAVRELDAAIKKRRASISSQQQQQPSIDFAKLARSKAARLSASLPDSMPLITPIASSNDDDGIDDGFQPPKQKEHDTPANTVIIETSVIINTNSIAEQAVDDNQPPIEPQQPKGMMMLSDDEDNTNNKDDMQSSKQPADLNLAPSLQSTIKPRRRMSAKKPRPSALQM